MNNLQDQPEITLDPIPQTGTTPARTTLEGEALAQFCATYAEDKKAEDVLILDVRGLTTIADFFVICTGNSPPHLRAIRDEITDKLRVNHGVRTHQRDGNLESLWLILDYGDVMVHVFHEEKRKFYALEDLWGDAPRLENKN